jgi:DNA adenine methylase
MTTLEPFLKWAGGKRWLSHRYANAFPKTFKRYVEPFLGSGAVFFCLSPKRAILADKNEELINAYRCVKKHSCVIESSLKCMEREHGSEQYYRVRGSVSDDPLDRAVRFIYLNRTCFNGLYRVNRKGEFNVPIGSKTAVQYPEGYLARVAKALAFARIRVADFESILSDTGRGDFVFVDPPYTVMHNTNNFIKYNASLFSWQDQVRLSLSVMKAAQRGADVMVSNADHESVRMLYRGFGHHHSIERASVLAGQSGSRRRTTELLITSYATQGL